MRIIVELDGPVLDVEPVYWGAYSETVRAIGLARTGRSSFWRLVRTAAPGGQAILGAKPRHIATYQSRLDELLESDDCLDRCCPQPAVQEALARLTKRARCALVTAGRNRAARQRRLDTESLSIHFMEMQGLSADKSRRPEQLRKLIEESPRALLAASTVGVVRAGAEAGMFPVGISNGDCTARRLTQAGAQIIFGDLGELADELDAGSPQLIRHGLLPEPPQVPPSPHMTPRRRLGGCSKAPMDGSRQ